MITTRPYQDECIANIRKDYQAGFKRLLVVLPTAGGKTIIFSRVLKARRGNGPGLVIAHTEELLSQARDKILKVWPQASIGLLKAESDDWNGPDVVVASIQTLSKHNRLSAIPQGFFSTIIVDEAHHAAAPSYRAVLDYLAPDSSNVLLVGFTATPNRGDGMGLRRVFNKVTFFRTIDQMVEEGWLVPAVSKYVNIAADFGKLKVSAGDFSLQSLDDTLNTEENNKDIVRAWWREAWKQGRKKTVVFTVSINHAKELDHWFLQARVRAVAIWGDHPDRERIIADFHSGLYDVIINCQVLTEGFDDDAVDCIVMARPTQSQALYAQMAGRGLRPILGTDGKADLTTKPNCLILDVVGNAVNHKLVTMPAIYGSGGYKPNTTKAKDVAKQAAPRKVRLKSYGDSRDVENSGYSFFSWLQLNDEDWAIQFPFKHSYFIRVRFNFTDGVWEYQHIYTMGFEPLGQVMDTFDTKEKAIAAAEAHILTVVQRPEKMARDAHWRKGKISTKQFGLLEKLDIQVDNAASLTIGEASDLITSYLVGRAITKLTMLEARNG